MYGRPRFPLALNHSGRLSLSTQDAIFTLPHIYTGGTYPSMSLEYVASVAESGTRYFLDLTTSVIKLCETVLRDTYNGGYQQDNSAAVPRFSYTIDHIRPSVIRYPYSSYAVLCVIQQANPESPVAQYTGKNGTYVENKYKYRTSNAYITPVQFDSNNGFITDSIRSIFDRLASAPLEAYHLPNTWTLDRTNPIYSKLSAPEHRLITGTECGWADTDGPVAFMPIEAWERIVKINKDNGIPVGVEHYALEVFDTVDPKTKIGKGWREIKVDLNAPPKPGVFYPIIRYISSVNNAGVIREHAVIHYAHFGPSLEEIRTKPEYKNISNATDMLVLDMYRPKEYWSNSPAVLEKFKPYTKYNPNQLNWLGKIYLQTLDKLNLNNPEYETILQDNDGALQDAHWNKLNFPKLLVRTEPGRVYKRTLVASFNKEKAFTEATLILQQHTAQRAKILENRNRVVQQLTTLKQQIAALEKSVSGWNETLSKQDALVKTVEQEYTALHKIAEQSKITEEDILKELGITKLPNQRQIWLKQNWILIDILYKNKVSGEIISIKKNDSLSLNPNWFLHSIEARTIRPSIIRVGVRNEPKWEEKYGKRVGGPWLFKVNVAVPGDEPKVHIFPAEKATIWGVDPATRGINVTSGNIKLHPHTAYMATYGDNNVYVAQNYHNPSRICLGEAVAALYQCFQSEDLNMILLTLNSWCTYADLFDDWGAQYKLFPKPEDIPCVAHNYSFEKKVSTYVSSTSDLNHLFYEIMYTDGLPNICLRFGSMVKAGNSWIIPSERGRTLKIECSAENVQTELLNRINSIMKKGYKLYNGELINQTSAVTEVLAEQTKENNETLNA